MKRLTMLVTVLIVSCAIAETTMSIEKHAEPWPAVVDGRHLVKAFRFKPSRIEFLTEGKVIETRLVVFHIQDAAVPAERFAVSLFGNEESIRSKLEKLKAADDGHVTVDASWVNMPLDFLVPVGVAHRQLLNRRLLIGKLRRTTPNTE